MHKFHRPRNIQIADTQVYEVPLVCLYRCSMENSLVVIITKPRGFAVTAVKLAATAPHLSVRPLGHLWIPSAAC